MSRVKLRAPLTISWRPAAARAEAVPEAEAPRLRTHVGGDWDQGEAKSFSVLGDTVCVLHDERVC